MPPPWIFHIYKELVTPSTPPEFLLSKTKPPQPLWKSLFSQKNIIEVKNDAICGYAMVFILFY